MDEYPEDYLKCKNVSRRVPIPNLIDNDSKQYWNDVFEKLDRQTKVLPHQRLKILEKTLENDVLYKVLRILKLDRKKSTDEPPDDTTSIGSLDYKSVPRRNTSLRFSICIPEETFSKLDFRTLLTKPQTSNRKREASMYIEFLNQPEETVAKWRSMPPVTFKGMNLSEKCEAITVAIATNFVDWLKSLGGDEVTILDVNVILNLFEIGFNAHAADALCVKVKELASVTKSIAEARKMPEVSYTAKLYKELLHDMRSIKKKENMFAFGTMLPVNMRSPPQNENVATKWLKNKRVPEELSTMAVVWKGIEHLKTTEGFCKWLQEHPDIEPPQYLVNKGLLESYVNYDQNKGAFKRYSSGSAVMHM